jgi:RNA polymerase sigma-70 factor, ECF subfamily
MDTNLDRTLLARLRERDEQAVRELADRYSSKIYQLAFRHLHNRQDAEEVTQDVLLKVYRKVDSFRGDSALSSWIYRITFNTAMSRLRSSRLARATEHERDRMEATDDDQRAPRANRQPDWSRMPDEAVLRSEMRRTVAAAIHDLPEIYRAPIVLRDIEGLTTEEAGRRLQLKDQTLKSRLHRGRLLLRDRLRNFEGGLALHARPASPEPVALPRTKAA